MDAIVVDHVKTLLAETFRVPVEEIRPDLAFGDLPEWDSMGHMDVMMGLEERFGVEVTTDTIGELISLQAICDYLLEKSKHGEVHC